LKLEKGGATMAEKDFKRKLSAILSADVVQYLSIEIVFKPL